MGDYFKQSQALTQASRHAAPLLVGAPPRIAINGRFLTQRSSGVQRFAMEAIKAIDALLERDYAALKGRIELSRRARRATSRSGISRSAAPDFSPATSGSRSSFRCTPPDACCSICACSGRW